MPPYGFANKRQQGFMFANHPQVAIKMAHEAQAHGAPVVRAANKKISPARRSKTQAERTVDAMRRLGK